MKTGPNAARELVNAGLRVVPVDAATKTPTDEGFGADSPGYCLDPSEFTPDECPAVLCGPCPAGGDKWLVCLDLDGGLTLEQLSARLGDLPPTLTSHGAAHAYYWVPPCEQRADLAQWNDVFGVRKTYAGPGKAPALDLKWAGGYAIERGDWDGPFDVRRISELPTKALNALLRARPARSDAPDFAADADDDGLLNARPEVIERAYMTSVATAPPAVAGNGAGEEAMLKMVTLLRRGYRLTAEAAWDLLCLYNQRAEPPFTEGQLQHKLNQGLGGSWVAPGALLTEAEREAIKRDKQPPSEREPDEFERLFMSAAAAVATVQQIDYLCKPLGIRSGRPGLWTADAKCGKSTLAASLAFAVATGTPLWSSLKVPTGRVCYVTAEDAEGIARVWKRLALALGYDITKLAAEQLRLANHSIMLGAATNFAHLQRMYRESDLVVFDTLRSLAGNAEIDENDPRFAESLYVLAKASHGMSCSTVVLHHNNKSGGMSGTAALFGASGNHLVFRRQDNGPVEGSAHGTRDGLSIPPFVVEANMASCAPPVDDPDSPGMVLTYRAAELGSRDNNVELVKGRIMQTLKHGLESELGPGHKKADLRALIGASGADFGEAIRQLATIKHISVENGRVKLV